MLTPPTITNGQTNADGSRSINLGWNLPESTAPQVGVQVLDDQENELFVYRTVDRVGQADFQISASVSARARTIEASSDGLIYESSEWVNL